MEGHRLALLHLQSFCACSYTHTHTQIFSCESKVQNKYSKRPIIRWSQTFWHVLNKPILCKHTHTRSTHTHNLPHLYLLAPLSLSAIHSATLCLWPHCNCGVQRAPINPNPSKNDSVLRRLFGWPCSNPRPHSTQKFENSSNWRANSLEVSEYFSTQCEVSGWGWRGLLPCYKPTA